MKHTFKITLVLISIFLIVQLVGIYTVSRYIQILPQEDGTIKIMHPDTIVGEQPDLTQDEKTLNFIPFVIAVIIATAVFLLIMKFRLMKMWKLWFFIAVASLLAVSFEVYIVNKWITLIAAIVIALFRIIRPNIYIHNLSEIFLYTGIIIIFLPWINVISAAIVLILISIYDVYAVWHSKHMVKMAKFQLESKMFAGIAVSYVAPSDKQLKGDNKVKGDKQVKAAKQQKAVEEKSANAILGGGDIAFPLLFACAIMEDLIIKFVPKGEAMLLSLIVTAGALAGLSLLLFYSKKERFYPAMPFISAGCFIGYGVLLLVIQAL